MRREIEAILEAFEVDDFDGLSEEMWDRLVTQLLNVASQPPAAPAFKIPAIATENSLASTLGPMHGTKLEFQAAPATPTLDRAVLFETANLLKMLPDAQFTDTIASRDEMLAAIGRAVVQSAAARPTPAVPPQDWSEHIALLNQLVKNIEDSSAWLNDNGARTPTPTSAKFREVIQELRRPNREAADLRAATPKETTK